jgi:aspartate/tyrosine/aromatic aminotransferase
LREKFGIYILECGKFDLSGINEDNVDYLASSIESIRKGE